MKWTRREFIKAGALAPIATAIQARPTASLSRIGGHAFGTYWRISLAGGVDPRTVRTLAEQVIGEVDGTMSPYRGDSALSRFNSTHSADWQPMPNAVCSVVDASLRIAQLTGGAFDPAVGPLVARFGFGPIDKPPAGSRLHLTVRDGAIRKTEPRLCIDLCGIAKGHALDRIVGGMDRLGVANYLIEIGGEVFARGRHPHERLWQSAIERPTLGPALEPTAVQRIIRLDASALATSGDSANFYELAGRRYCHLIDPRSGQPVDNGLASVSVIAPDALTADGLATSLMVMGPERGPRLAERESISALFIRREKAGLYETMTAGFAALVVA